MLVRDAAQLLDAEEKVTRGDEEWKCEMETTFIFCLLVLILGVTKHSSPTDPFDNITDDVDTAN